MQEFKVWAPEPESVTLLSGGRELRMHRGSGGWWHVSDERAGPGTHYGFCLDGGPPRPDPRSPSQPGGPEDLSEVVDQSAFAWKDASWTGMTMKGAVLYEIHVGTFTAEGTFDAAIEKLPLLVDIGVDAVELMPVAEFPGDRGWGYDGVNLFAPHHAYGGPDGLKRFVDTCHCYGLGVVMDVVYNHLGPSGNYLPEFGPYFSDRHQTNWGSAINFDGSGSDEVRRFVIDNALGWLRDYHADGLRLDAVHAIVDDSARHVLEQLSAEVDALSSHLRRPLTVIAETDLNDPRFVRPLDSGGYGLDSAWADEWHHALHAALAGERTGYYEDFGSLAHLGRALRQAWVYDGTWSRHRGRHHGRSPSGLPGHRFVVFTQNHDQVGNRPLGERSSALMNEGRLRIAAALLLTGPFTPLLFQGEEWGATSPFLYFTDHHDPELGRAVSEGRRNEFPYWSAGTGDVPDPQAPTTFNRSKLNWDEREQAPHGCLLAWYKRLIALRRRFADLSDPRLERTEVIVEEETQTVVVHRGVFTVLVNLSAVMQDFPLVPSWDLIAASSPDITSAGEAVSLPPDSVAIVRTA
ncbi:MAG TPA: malto-oligosyltrehalose trehalohydrolase [Acidimicrobiales bacterium]|nr:malto-oligosyltrehalose trehalohydrolase [Acidimicrobiales bacterium]